MYIFIVLSCCLWQQLASLKQELLNLDLHTINGRPQLRSFIGSNGTSDDRSGDTTGTSKCHFAVNLVDWCVGKCEMAQHCTARRKDMMRSSFKVTPSPSISSSATSLTSNLLTLEQTHRGHSCLRTATANATKSQWVLHRRT